MLETGDLAVAQMPSEQWHDYSGVLAGVTAAISSPHCWAVFLVGSPGLGATSLLNQLNRKPSVGRHIVDVRATTSLSTVEYGALAPFLLGLTPEDLELPQSVLRALREQLGLGDPNVEPALILVDDAHTLDPSSAEILAHIVRAGWAKLVASASPYPGIPGPLLRFWIDGAAERFDLHPLSKKDAQEFCQTLLGGPVLRSTAQQMYAESNGNPLFLKALVEEAQASGELEKRRGIWLNQGITGIRPPKLATVVERYLRDLTPSERECLELVALAEPVERHLIEALTGERETRRLAEIGFISTTAESVYVGQGKPAPLIKLTIPVIGELLRRTTSRARSLNWHRRFRLHAGYDGGGEMGLVRRVTWALDSGSEVPDELILRAAVIACNLFESEQAVRLAPAVRNHELSSETSAVLARAYFNLGSFGEAWAFLGYGGPRMSVANNPQHRPTMFNSLLRAGIRMALGQAPAQLAADAAALRESGSNSGADGVSDLVIEGRASVIEMMGQSISGDYAGMSRILGGSGAELGTDNDSPDDILNQALMCALDAERLCAQGAPVKGQAAAAEAIALLENYHNEAFVLHEWIALRSIICALFAGHWDAATAQVEGYFASTAGVSAALSGGDYTIRGFIAVRRGSFPEALEILETGMEALRVLDPQQIFGVCAGLAAYCAARDGQLQRASNLLAEHQRDSSKGVYLLRFMANAFAAAAREYIVSAQNKDSLASDILGNDPSNYGTNGDGLSLLLGLAAEARSKGAGMLEMMALDLVMDLGDRSETQRFVALTAEVEGPWAQALHGYSAALATGNTDGLLTAAASLQRAGLDGLAAGAYAEVLNELGTGSNREARQWARSGLAAIRPEASAPTALTKREKLVISLARQGLSDRDIAQELQLSVRTVEGHLYRSYIKLDIPGREYLAHLEEHQIQ
ncbi:LuxR C-terminal-related transcriptional regulator [Pseudarthrobacter sp. J1738]|uniref:LuxR C-terminal-related transcriptional regulator n=1 Tax=Pseudarthrobacter sp. J1738 TaxID=3420446 RepID=UPI003D297FA7